MKDVIRAQVEYWQSQYPKAVAAQVEKIVRDAYEEVAAAKVSHMHALTGAVLSEGRCGSPRSARW